MRRISLMGISGGGKTTLGRALAERLALPYVELDALQHGPNWRQATPEELRARVSAALRSAPDGWVVDGNYHSSLGGTVLDRADTVVFLDPPLWTAFWRVVWRTGSRAALRQELWNGNRESFRTMLLSRYSMPLWVLRQHGRFRRRVPEILSAHPHVDVVRITTGSEARRWLQSAEPAAQAAPATGAG